MELGGKDINLEVKPYTNPVRDPYPEAKPDSDSALATFPTKKEHKNQRTRGDQAAKYRECQKNHAASTGGYVIDGCCEFMAGGEEGTLTALKCAVCNCHRSFHRKEMYGQKSSKQELITPPFYYSNNNSFKEMQPRGVYPTGEIGRRISSSSEDMKKILSQRKKRVRTKINEEQKKKMKEFAERLGWRIQKKDEDEIDKFCRIVNLRRKVFKVWIHNNKQAMKKNIIDLQN